MLSFSSVAQQWLVDSPQAYKNALKKVKAGDKIVLANGVWQDFEILFKGEGTQDSPITLTAQTKGKVILSGQSNLRLAGKHLVVSGLVFKNGFSPSSAVISFRQNKHTLAYHSRVSEVVIDNFNNPDKQESDYWVALYGQYNRFDHSYLVGKRNKGVTMAVRLDSKESQNNHHLIDFNYFGPRPIFGSNGGETLRIGTSHYSLTDSFTRVENNYFDRCDGEVEIISVKSGRNTIKNNVFFESRGTLTLRHGNYNTVTDNVFFGNGVDHTGGIRVINKHQRINNNYMEGLTGYRFGSGFTVMNGVPNSSINRYHQVDDALIENNSLYNVSHIQLAAGSDEERSATPVNSVVKGNIIVNDNGQQPFTLFDDVSGIRFANNIANTQVVESLVSGVEKQDITLKRAQNGLLYPVAPAQQKYGVSRSLTPIAKAKTGPVWYEKRAASTEFSSGDIHVIDAKEGVLFSAVKQANDGDVILLNDGHYEISKLISIDKTLTIKAKNKGGAKLSFQRTSLFEIANGGSLTLDGLLLDGSQSPDSSGNTLIRTQKWGMVDNYRFVMKNSTVQGLDINHSFHFFDSGKGAFADYISLTNNQFSTVTGDILRLDKEVEDLGIYNAEYVTLKGNRFQNVEGALVKLYRGGTDESTFGPHLVMTNNTVNTVGKGKRNKANASVYIHGVQVGTVQDNTFNNSNIIRVEHTVGEPITHINGNTFIKTDKPSVIELKAKGPHTADVSNNQYHSN
ncbi:polysaccharide lyase 6 family protein [Thalassotalea piscium]